MTEAAMMPDPKALIRKRDAANAGPMERAIRKWDGDVFHGHEPEAWADLRCRAREQDAENERLRAQVARLRAALTKAERLAVDGVKAERWSIERGVLHEQIAKLAHATLAETEEGA